MKKVLYSHFETYDLPEGLDLPIGEYYNGTDTSIQVRIVYDLADLKEVIFQKPITIKIGDDEIVYRFAQVAIFSGWARMRKIDAIKWVREKLHGIGLKEAKYLVDELLEEIFDK